MIIRVIIVVFYKIIFVILNDDTDHVAVVYGLTSHCITVCIEVAVYSLDRDDIHAVFLFYSSNIVSIWNCWYNTMD